MRYGGPAVLLGRKQLNTQRGMARHVVVPHTLKESPKIINRSSTASDNASLQYTDAEGFLETII